MIVQHGNDKSDSMQNLAVLGMAQNRTINVRSKELGESEPYKQYNSNVQLLEGDLQGYQQHGPLVTNPSNFVINGTSFTRDVDTIQMKYEAEEKLHDVNNSHESIDDTDQFKKEHMTGKFTGEMDATQTTVVAAATT